ncbi:MAG: hypothetical protein A2Y40_03125 [Candidatus Margulisbacteria bacterium GWF2_35_9]|nr:MAG: hypothetical protein A2Y40_03125 [Candidatus Margulisbacteria bacterium GWF2_35_9]
MKKILKALSSWQFIFPILLIVLSSILYEAHYQLFHDAHHIFIYFLGDLAFVPIEVLLVSIIIHRIMSQKEKSIKMNKLNMIIGAFFSEVGSDLIAKIAEYDENAEEITKKLVVTANWDDKNFIFTHSCLNTHKYEIIIKKEDIVILREFLVEKREFLLRLLENPNLLEHDAFTDLLWAVFHLIDELLHRKKISECTKEDLHHIENDIKRVYCLLTKEWLIYMKHLKKDYPYLFSLAIRTNPFDKNASAVIKNA